MTFTKEDFFKAQEKSFGKNVPEWQERADQTWAAMEEAVKWFDQPLPSNSIIIIEGKFAPETFFNKWLYWLREDLRKDGYVVLIPPGFGGHFTGHTFPLPNGWCIRLRSNNGISI